MTRLLIVADMEGISGIERYEQCAPGHPDYEHGVQLLSDEINVIADVAWAFGASSISVIDWHAGGGNLREDLLDERVKIVPEDLSGGYDLAFLVGFHPMAGDQSGFISHTMTQGVAVEVHGKQVGEIGLISWWLGEAGVPVGLITGDRAATVEADRFFPDTPLHTVKQAESWSRAACLPVDKSYDALRQRVARVLEQRGRWNTYRISEPIPVRLRLREEHPLVGTLPWLEPQPDGWFAGDVQKPRDVIDLLDIVAGLMRLKRRDEWLSRLRAHSDVSTLLDQMLLEDIHAAVERGGWVVE